jgi:hypothetical protein
MVQFSNFYGIIVEGCEDALCHEFYVVGASWEFKTIELCEFLKYEID